MSHETNKKRAGGLYRRPSSPSPLSSSSLPCVVVVFVFIVAVAVAALSLVAVVMVVWWMRKAPFQLTKQCHVTCGESHLRWQASRGASIS